MKIFSEQMDLNYEEGMAKQGDVDAMIRVAFYILFAHPAEPVDDVNAALAIKYYKAAAAAGRKEGMLDLGAAYMDGRGVERDPEEALRWYRKGFDPDDGNSCWVLGCVYRYDYLDKKEVPVEDTDRIREALNFFRRGAEFCNSDCLYELGELYFNGIGVRQDYEQAFDYFSDAYDEIDPDLMSGRAARIYLRLGQCYIHGWGTESDEDYGKELLEDAWSEWTSRKSWGMDEEPEYKENCRKELAALKKIHPSE